MRRGIAQIAGLRERFRDAVGADMARELADQPAAAPDIRPRSEALTPQRLA